MPLAYVYARFSKDTQEKGDSIRRQRELALTWIRRRPDVQLDASLGEGGFFIDHGLTGFAVSGERRLNLDNYALGDFIRLAESGRVRPGSMLVVESADRLTRESPAVGLHLVTKLLLLGVVVVTLAPEMEFRTDADIGRLISIGVSIDRAHDESRVKNVRGKNAWGAKRASAATQPLTTLVPWWCKLAGARRVANRLVGGTIKADEAKAALIRRMFDLAKAGVSARAIAKRLNAEKAPPPARAKAWNESAVFNILKSRKLLGEYRPHTGRTGSSRKGRPETRKPTGEVVHDYYPKVVSPEDFALVQEAIRQRTTFRGRRGRHVNLFAGLLYDARDGGKVIYRHGTNARSKLLPANANAGLVSFRTFQADVFDAAILSRLAELKAADVMPEADPGGEIPRLAARLAEKDEELREFREQIDEEPRLLKSLRPTLVRLETEREELAERLAAARRDAASPLGDTLGEIQDVAKLLADDSSEDLRLRCRSAIRRLIESVHVLIGGSRMARLAAVRVQFRGSEAHRDYLVMYLARNRQRMNPPPPVVRSFADAGLPGLDLRNPADAAAVEAALARVSPTSLRE